MKNFFMFDFLITPWIIRVLYILGQILVFFAAFGFADKMFYGDTEVTMGFVFSLLSIPLWRMICEGWIVLFRISENISVFVHNSQTTKSQPDNISVKSTEAKSWKCPKCSAINSGDLYECSKCQYKLV